MNLMNINSIAEAITLRMEKENNLHLAKNITVDIQVDEDTLHKIDEECFKLTKQKNPFQQGDVIKIKLGEIQFKISKSRKEEI